MFTDRLQLQLIAGKGGNGVVAWRREKYLPKGGPCGGNGGLGGSIILVADTNTYSLEAYRRRRILKAESGQSGASNNRQGRRGQDLLVKVPVGTLVKDSESGEVLFDLNEKGVRYPICRGGKGGKGNTFFATPTNRAPIKATPGKEGEKASVELELKLIADVGLVGFPNAGKSTLLGSLSHIHTKAAPYPFTTLKPTLGYVMCEQGRRIVMADIPGIIEGAHQNKGLGLEFLRHIERTHILLFVIDMSGIDGRDPLEDFTVLRKEIEAYSPEVAAKPFAIALNKTDCEEAQENLVRFHEKYAGDIFEISALCGCGLYELVDFLKRKLSTYMSPEKSAMVAPAGQSSL